MFLGTTEQSGDPSPDHFVGRSLVRKTLGEIDGLILNGQAGHSADHRFLNLRHSPNLRFSLSLC